MQETGCSTDPHKWVVVVQESPKGYCGMVEWCEELQALRISSGGRVAVRALPQWVDAVWATPAPASVEGNSPEIPDSCPVCKTGTAGGICLPCYESGHDDAQPADHIGDANEMVPAEDSKGECAGCEFEKRYGIKITYLTHTCQKAKGE